MLKYRDQVYSRDAGQCVTLVAWLSMLRLATLLHLTAFVDFSTQTLPTLQAHSATNSPHGSSRTPQALVDGQQLNARMKIVSNQKLPHFDAVKGPAEILPKCGIFVLSDDPELGKNFLTSNFGSEPTRQVRTCRGNGETTQLFRKVCYTIRPRISTASRCSEGQMGNGSSTVSRPAEAPVPTDESEESSAKIERRGELPLLRTSKMSG